MQSDFNVDDAEADEVGLQANDVLASPQEVETAIHNLLQDVSARKRLIAVASIYLDTKPHLKRQYEPEDLFFEALERIVRGFRKWPRNRLDFSGLVIGVIKSWASSREKTLAREDDHVVMQHELIVTDGEDETLSLEQVATDSSTPLDELEARETDAEAQGLLVLLRMQYEASELPAKILDTLFCGAYESHQEAIEALGVEDAEYRNAWKRLLRGATALKPKEKNNEL